MAIPKRGSRTIVADGHAYRWYVRRKPSYGQMEMYWTYGDGRMGLAIQSRDDVRGAVLAIELVRRHPERGGHTAEPVTPAEVAEHIRAALAAGWEPTKPGPMFHVAPQRRG